MNSTKGCVIDLDSGQSMQIIEIFICNKIDGHSNYSLVKHVIVKKSINSLFVAQLPEGIGF
jgi:hypothetical protein